MALQITSRFLADGQQVPLRYTCDGQNMSPPLQWTGQPADAKSLVLICEDPDAQSGTFTHWLLYDLAAGVGGLIEGQTELGRSGRNSFNRIGYCGPCPPLGDASHRYVFHLFAVDVESIGDEGLSRAEVIGALQGHVLAEGQLLVKYRRRPSSSAA